MSEIAGALRRARETLAAAGVDSPATDAAELAACVLGTSAAQVQRFAILGQSWTSDQQGEFERLVERRAERVPLQHLTGQAYFRSLTLAVGPGVFVPRPESEITAGLAIEAVRAASAAGRDHPVVADLCSGSGAIALAIEQECPQAQVYAVELSDEAFAWAKRNVDALGARVVLHHGDARVALPGMEGTLDVVSVNPPYIPSAMVPRQREVRDHDPPQALYGGSDDGLAIPMAVAHRAQELLRPGGVLVMEHADVQGDVIGARLAEDGWVEIVDHCDLSGRPRVVVARRHH